jgi:serine/threonine protein kinase
MFSGNHPFKASNNMDFCNRVLNYQINFNSREWKSVSSEAKTLIRGMLAKSPSSRLSYEELLKSKWMKKYCSPKTKPKYFSSQSTKNLMLFNSERQLELAL